MKSIIFATALIAPAAFAQVSCQTIGNNTFCTDGRSYQSIGNNIFGSDGSSAQRIGNQTFITPAPPQYVPPPQIQVPQIQMPQLQTFPQQRQCGYNAYGQYVCR